MTTVVCVLKSGGCYTPEYVERLKAGVDKHLSGHNFICFSDVDVPCDRIKLTRNLPGWWSKLEIFKLTGACLYFDLDTVITGDLSEIAEYPHTFTMLSDFYVLDKPASGVMAWSGDYRYILDDYDHNKTYSGHGDQGYIATKVMPERFQSLFAGQVVSRKVTGTRNPNERVVCFHGEPRPHAVNWEV
jgi:hypothetical protein